ncbi:MAG: extracellular solute-binding protein [Clostridia bacterium]|nr:extracellular solute-binding protein [Clostridia bacterium]
MKQNIRKILALLLCTACVACTAGCGASTDTPDGGGTEQQTPVGEAEEEAPAEEPFVPSLSPDTAATVHVAGHYNNFEALEAEFDRFNEYYPDVELSYTYLDNYNGTIEVALSGAEAPDIFFSYPWMLEREDLQSVIETAEDLSDPSLGMNLSCVQEKLLYRDANGRIPILPVFCTTYGMLVNEEIFEKEGLSVPKTYEELLSVCDALQKAGYSSPMMGYSRGSFMLFPLSFPYFCAEIQGNGEALENLNALTPEAGEYARDALALAADFLDHGYIDMKACDKLENDYQAVILRFFEGDVPMMLATAGTVSGTEKRESMSEAYIAHPFKYSYHPVPSTGEGGYFLNQLSMGFSVNRNSENLDMANEFMRFLTRTEELSRMAQIKRMVTPCRDMSFDGVYASFGELDDGHVIYLSEVGLDDEPDKQMRYAGTRICNGSMTVDEAVAAFGTLLN